MQTDSWFLAWGWLLAWGWFARNRALLMVSLCRQSPAHFRFGQIDAPWLTHFDIDVSDVDADGGDVGTAAPAPSPSPNLLAAGIAHRPGSDSVKKNAAASSPWVSRFHIAVEGADHPAYIPPSTYKSCHEVGHLFPVNQFDHLERSDITHLNSLGAARRKKHPWHPHIESNWLDDHSDDEGMIAAWTSHFQPVNEFDPNTDDPDAHEVHDLSLGAHRKRKHGSWHPPVEPNWMLTVTDADGDIDDEMEAFAVAHPLNTYEPHDDNHHLNLGAHRVQKHRWHAHVASDWLNEDSYPHPVNDFTVIAVSDGITHALSFVFAWGAAFYYILQYIFWGEREVAFHSGTVNLQVDRNISGIFP